MPQREQCVCFTGHRELEEAELPGLRQALELTLEAAWAQGYRYFYNGGALGFDLMAAEAVLACKRRHQEIALEIVVPHAHQTSGWPEVERCRYERLRYMADRWSSFLPCIIVGVIMCETATWWIAQGCACATLTICGVERPTP